MATASAPATVKPAQIQTRSSREHELQVRLVDLCGQAQRCAIACDEDAEKATTLAAAIKSQVKALDEDRKSITDPLNGVVKDINARYKALAEPAAPALDKLIGPRGELTRWNLEKERQRREAEQRAREEQERLRLEEAARIEEEAARLRAAGDNEAAEIAQQQADAALEDAAEAPSKINAPPPVTRGALGGSSGLQSVGKFRVTNMTALVEAELDRVKRGLGLQYLVLDESELGKLARAKGPKPEIAGVEFYTDKVSRVW